MSECEWVLLGVSVCWLITLVWVRNMAYRHGIWDGAFNQFLPIVQREMRWYAPHRAAEILGEEV
jgi:hypothetical protein